MSYTQQSSSNPMPSPQPKPGKKDDRKLVYGILIAALLGTWGYLIWDKSQNKETMTQLQSQVTSVDSSRNAIQQEYNDALARLDSATGNNTQLQGALAERKAEIAALHSARGPLELQGGVQPQVYHLQHSFLHTGIALHEPPTNAWLQPVERKPWVKYYEEQASIIKENTVPQLSVLQRLGPSFLVLLHSGCEQAL